MRQADEMQVLLFALWCNSCDGDKVLGLVKRTEMKACVSDLGRILEQELCFSTMVEWEHFHCL